MGAEREPDLALLAVGGSAGSLGPLIELVGGLPADLPAAVLVCQHLGEQGPSRLPQILGRRGVLPSAWAMDGDPLKAGRIYVAPPGHHLLVHAQHVRLSPGPRVNRHRPSVDVLFASLAQTSGAQVTVVVLSGVLDDGAVGSALVDQAGGQVLVQDPEASEFAGMPRAALAASPRARIIRGESIGQEVMAAMSVGSTGGGLSQRAPEPDPEVGMQDEVSPSPGFLLPGETGLTRLACPECGGGLARVDLPQITYFRCHVGHQYGPQSLLAALGDATEGRLWSAVAALEEQAAAQGYLEAATTGGSRSAAPPFSRGSRARDLTDRAAALREHVQRWTATDSELGARPEDQLSVSGESS